jgi:uncharacterized protein (DUF1330 family)
MLYITVHLYGKTGVAGEFKDYESKALNIFRRHGGDVIVAYRPVRQSGAENVPDEIQILRIADQATLERFMKDPERVSMAAERDAVIQRTDLYLSDALVDY